VRDCPVCLENLRSPRCKREDCASAAAELHRYRELAQDLRRQFADGHGVFEAMAYLTRAIEAEHRMEVLGTRAALAERGSRRYVRSRLGSRP
jgi:hypothetical protein